VFEFKDKPFNPSGEPGPDPARDFCYKRDMALTSDVATFTYGYSVILASGGGDLPEASFQGLLQAFLDDYVGWRSIGNGTNQTGAHLVILSTDAQTHLETDMASLLQTNPDYPQLPTHDGAFSNQSYPEYDCENKFYPSKEQVLAAKNSLDMSYVAFLTPDDDAAVVSTWQYVNTYFGQPSDFYQIITNDSSNLIDGVLKAIEAVTEVACAVSTTTTTTVATTSGASTSTSEVTTTPSTTTVASTTTATTTTSEVTTTPSTTVAASESTTVAASESTTVVSTLTATIATELAETSSSTIGVTTTIGEATATTTSIVNTPEQTGSTDEATRPPCGSCPSCGCPEVLLSVRERPKKLQLDIEYEDRTESMSVTSE